MVKSKKLSEDILVEETGGFIRLCCLELNGEKSNEIFLSEQEAKKLNKFLNKFDYSNIKRVQKLRELEK